MESRWDRGSFSLVGLFQYLCQLRHTHPSWLACVWYISAFTWETHSLPILSPSSFLSYRVKSFGLRVLCLSECEHIRWLLGLFLRVCAIIQLGIHGQTTGLGVVGRSSSSSLGYLGTLMVERSNLPFSDGRGDPSSWCTLSLTCVSADSSVGSVRIIGILYSDTTVEVSGPNCSQMAYNFNKKLNMFEIIVVQFLSDKRN